MTRPTWPFAPVRQPAYQQQFLAMPLAQRKAIIEGIRKNSQDANQSKEMAIMDVNADAIAALFAQTGTDVLIHGHAPPCPAPPGRRASCAMCCRTGNTTWKRRAAAGLTADGALHRHDVNGDEIA
jgi:UDP-2,3-diacylglucosamine hydrolase